MERKCLVKFTIMIGCHPSPTLGLASSCPMGRGLSRSWAQRQDSCGLVWTPHPSHDRVWAVGGPNRQGFAVTEELRI